MKTYARIAAAAFVGIAITMSVLQMLEPASPAAEMVSAPADESEHDPLRAELQRCQTLGVEAAEDRRCLNAWATQRSRFFQSSVSHYPELKSGNGPPVADSESPEPVLDSQSEIASDEER